MRLVYEADGTVTRASYLVSILTTPISMSFKDRPQHKLVLFDVDGPLTLARQRVSPETTATLRALRKRVAIGFVGGSDLVKISEQLTVNGSNVVEDFDYAFAENGLTAFKLGKPLANQSFIKFLGEEKYKPLVNFILHYIADLDLPIKRGTFVEFRNGMINVCPMGRNATIAERYDFAAYDKIHNVRQKFVKILQDKFSDYGLTFAIGGQVSFDVFPNGWDKTYALNHVMDEGFEEIHFFGDKTEKGGNDYEIFSDSRTIGHTVTCPEDTIKALNELFLKD
jgi:phosphomannomutase